MFGHFFVRLKGSSYEPKLQLENEGILTELMICQDS